MQVTALLSGAALVFRPLVCKMTWGRRAQEGSRQLLAPVPPLNHLAREQQSW